MDSCHFLIYMGYNDSESLSDQIESPNRNQTESMRLTLKIMYKHDMTRVCHLQAENGAFPAPFLSVYIRFFQCLCGF